MNLDRLSDTPNSAHTMNVKLTKIDFCTISGEWYIDADVTIDGNKPVSVKTTTEYGTAYIADQACHNTAEAFEEAVTNFIKKVLNHKDIVKALQ